MKRTIVLCLAFLIAIAGYSQGVKKTTVKKPETTFVQPKADSVVIKGAYRQDTAKVVAVVYVEDGTLAWVKGYVVVRSFVPQGGNPQATEQVVLNDKFEVIKPEDLYDVRRLDWKK